MNSKSLAPIYFILMGFFCFGIYWVLRQQPVSVTDLSAYENLNFTESLKTPLCRFLLQLFLILVFSQLVGRILSKFGQPLVMGEVLAGIILGPSLFGLLLPNQFNFIFQQQSLGALQIVSQLGLILFMFTVGLNIKPDEWRSYGHKTIFISHASIVIPFLLGLVLSFFLYDSFAPAHTNFSSFALFTGISMSITAFPVLARIIFDRKIGHLNTARLALGCAAIDDISAWIILAGIIGLARSGTFILFILTLLYSAFGVFFLLKIVNPLLNKFLARTQSEQTRFTAAIAVLLGSAIFFEWSGVHALFGAFIAGATLPNIESFRNAVQEKLEYISSIILLPTFFAITGLRTQITLLNSGTAWIFTFIIIVVAVLGKFGGTTLAARYTGRSWSEAGFLGILMNTRGLMELVVLNIGLEIGILSQTLYTMMVMMALVTTFMTGPCLSLINLKKVG